ncbi:hypothetical protein ACMZ5D_08550, partial [Acinetobacter baumannii]
MQFPLNSSLSHTIFRLGTWYGLYRLIIAVSLNIILVLTDAQTDNSLQQPALYSYTLLGYSLLSLVPVSYTHLTLPTTNLGCRSR